MIFNFPHNKFDPIRWAELFLNVMMIAYRFGEVLSATSVLQEDGCVRLEVELGPRTMEAINIEDEINFMGGSKDERESVR